MVGDMLTRTQARILHRIRIDNSGCWIWPTTVEPHGYGHISVKDKIRRVHRVSYEVFNGPIPEGLVVRHRCDVRACVNPEHLEVGTYQDNHDDRVLRTLKRQVITPVLAEQIKSDYLSGKGNQRALAATYRTSQSTVSKILRGVWH